LHKRGIFFESSSLFLESLEPVMESDVLILLCTIILCVIFFVYSLTNKMSKVDYSTTGGC